MKKYIAGGMGVQKKKNVIIGHMRHSSCGDLVSRHTSTSICDMGNGGGVGVSEGMANKEDLFVDPCRGRAELSLSGLA